MAESEREKLRSKTPVIAAQVGATLTVTVAMSFLGVAGTVTGLIAGTVISQVSAFFYEQWVTLARHTAQRKADQLRAARREGTQPGRQAPRPVPRYHLSVPYRALAASALAVLVLSGAVIVTLELAASKPVAAIVTQSRGSGTSLTGGTVDPQPSSPAPSPTGTVSPTGTASPSAAPAPSATPSQPAASQAATPPGGTPSASPATSPPKASPSAPPVP